MEEEIVLGNSTYVIPVPPRFNNTAEAQVHGTTETAIGILCACITLSAILLFLWKFVKRKQESMITELQQQVINLETGKSKSSNMLEPQSKPDTPSSSRSITPPKHKESKKMDKTTNSIRKTPLLKSSLSKGCPRKEKDNPLPSSLSRRKRLSTRSCGRSLLSDYKAYTELESFDTKDMVLSLKDDRAAIRERMARRREAMDKASRYLEECFATLSSLKKSVKEAVSRRKKKATHKTAELLTSVTKDLSAKYAFPYDSSIRWTSKTKDSFDSIQYCLQGLRSHKEVQGSLQDLAALRDGHRKDSEKDLRQKCMVARSTSAIWECQESIRQAKQRMKELDDQNFIRLLHTSSMRRNGLECSKPREKEKSQKRHNKKQFIVQSSRVHPEEIRESEATNKATKSNNLPAATNKKRSTEGQKRLKSAFARSGSEKPANYSETNASISKEKPLHSRRHSRNPASSEQV